MLRWFVLSGYANENSSCSRSMSFITERALPRFNGAQYPSETSAETSCNPQKEISEVS
jgi:hypothetical protein